MKKIIKNIFVMSIVCVMIFSMSACNSKSKSKLVGQWKYVDNGSSTWVEFDNIEFFSDGTYMSDDANYNGAYTAENGRLRLSGVLMEPIVCSYEVKGNILTLIFDEYVWTFEKIN